MKKTNLITKSLSLILALLMLGTVILTACGEAEEQEGATFNPEGETIVNDDGTIETLDYYEWTNDTFTDSSQLKSWADLGQSKQLKLIAWNTLQTGNFKKLTASNDVVYPEIQRITGVTLDMEKSFDNGGMNADAKYQQVMTTGLPDIAYGNWVDPEEVYDLTEYIQQYCPTIWARMPKSVWSASNINGGQPGKIYAVPYGIGDVDLSSVDPEADADSCIMFNGQTDYYPYILVREDILKDAYPDALTTDEIKAIYAENGSFTEEELFDVEITSAQQFREEFLKNIYDAIHTTKNEDGSYKYQINKNRWVEVISIGYGNDGDTWDLMGSLIPKLVGATGCGINTQQSYWDAVDNKIKILMKQDFYLEELEEWVDLVAEGKYVDDYGILESKQTIKQDYNNGYFAIGYGSSTKADNDRAKLADGSTVNYRRVYLKIEKNEHFEFLQVQEPAVNGVCIFKDSVSEDDLIQILRWLDFQCSELCDKLVGWGPASAGLFTEDENGVRTFKSEELANQMVYSTLTLGTEAQKYNLLNGTADSPNRVFTFFYQGGSKDHPKTVYDLSTLTDMVYSAYSSAAVFPEKTSEIVGTAIPPCIWQWSDSDLDGVEAVWSKRPMVEKALYQVLRSGNNFDKEWANAVKAMDSAGWTDEYFATVYTEAFLTINEDYLDGLLK